MVSSLDWRWVAAIATGVALNLAQSVTPWWPAMWFALVPLLVAVLFTERLHETLKLAAAASLLGRLPSVLPIVHAQTIEDALFIALTAPLFIIPFAVPLVAITGIWRFIVADGRAWYSPLAFSVTAASVDLLFTSISSHGSWSSWANSQMNVLPVLQSAALGGAPLVVFVCTLPAATIAVAIARRRTIEAPTVAYGLPLSLVLAAIVYGYVRLAETPLMVRVPVGLVASDRADILPPEPGGTSDSTLAAYFEAATLLTRQGATLVMLPEKLEFFDERASVRVRDRLAAWARDHDTRLVAGFGVLRQEYRDNIAWLFDRNGELMAQYSKQHLVPLLEMRYRPGEHDVVVHLDGRKFGIAICKDMGFPRFARRYGREGIDAMLTPAWDFVSDGEYHARMAVLRGIEQGFSVIRTANQGMLTVSDPYGRIVAERKSSDSAVATLFAEAPVGSVPTVYRQYGDVFGWTCVVVVVVMTIRIVGQRRRTHTRTWPTRDVATPMIRSA